MSKLQTRNTKTLYLNTLEASRYVNYPETANYEKMTFPELQPFKLGAHSDSIKCRFGKVATIKQGKAKDCTRYSSEIDQVNFH